MNSRELINGLKANYPESTYPSELHEKDMLRTIMNFGYTSTDLSNLYDELLKTCNYFPKVFDIHRCSQALGINSHKIDSEELNKTRELLKSYNNHEEGTMSFKDWINGGGIAQIRRDCDYDEVKVQKILNIMGAAVRQEAPREEKPAKEMTFLVDALPAYDFPEIVSLDEL
jgi:hypothetical protein